MVKIRKKKLPDHIKNRSGREKYTNIYDAIKKLEPGESFLCFDDEADDDVILRAMQALRGRKKSLGIDYSVYVDLRVDGDRGLWIQRNS